VNTEVVDGVFVVREGSERIRWRHEINHWPPPLHIEGWQVGDVWPTADEASRLHRQIDDGQPVLVMISAADTLVDLPSEHVRSAPREIIADYDVASDFVRIQVTPLEWLPGALRRRGLAFASYCRDWLARTPRSLLPAVLTEEGLAFADSSVQFIYVTGTRSLNRPDLHELITHLFRTNSDVVPLRMKCGAR
jgi:hypothetical protein